MTARFDHKCETRQIVKHEVLSNDICLNIFNYYFTLPVKYTQTSALVSFLCNFSMNGVVYKCMLYVYAYQPNNFGSLKYQNLALFSTWCSQTILF